MGDYYYLNKNADPVLAGPVLDPEFVALWESPDGRRVANTERDDVRVSTVFLGIDHSFGGPGPVLYETLVFGGALDGDGDRYTFRDQAEAGHLEFVAKVFGDSPPDTTWGPASRRPMADVTND